MAGSAGSSRAGGWEAGGGGDRGGSGDEAADAGDFKRAHEWYGNAYRAAAGPGGGNE
jgi:hypothetical protein